MITTDPERLARLNTEQKEIVLKRNKKIQARSNLIDQIALSKDSDVHQHIFDQLRDMEDDECEHGRAYIKHCLECGKIDHLLYPEYFDEDGFRIE